jgi:hypothetical protein
VDAPIEFSFLTPDLGRAEYEEKCDVVGLEPTEDGWGLLHCVSEGGRVTRITSDVEYMRALVSGPEVAFESVPPEKFPIARLGWPSDWQGGVKQQRPGRNDLCPCGSGKKYKWCHGSRGPVAPGASV